MWYIQCALLQPSVTVGEEESETNETGLPLASRRNEPHIG